MLEPIVIASLHTEVQNRIRQYILDMSLKPGDRLPTEHEIARQLQVSRNVVREALKALQAVGLVDAQKGAGTVVAGFDPARYLDYYTYSLIAQGVDVSDLLDVRKALELSFIERAVAHIGLDDLRELDRLIQQMETAGTVGRTERTAGLRIHQIAYRCLNNGVLSGLLGAFNQINRRIDLQLGVQDSPARVARDVELHRRFVRAMHERDAVAAKAALQDEFAPEHAVSWSDGQRAALQDVGMEANPGEGVMLGMAPE